MFRRGLRPAVIRLYDEHEAEHLLEEIRQGDGEPLLILGFDGPQRLVEAEEDLALAICVERSGRDLGRGIGERWERNRFDASWLERGNGEGRMADAIEISGRWSVLPSLYERVTGQLAPRVDALWAHFSHFYPQGGSIYFIVFLSDASPGRLLERYAEVWETVMRATLDEGGSISHHHGIGEARLPWIREELGSGYEVLAAIKRALDPQGTLNVGRFGLPPEGEG
jgi:alkyldihydroxyacetonephosphate synthase